MAELLQVNYALFQDINTHAGHWLWLDDFMIFCANYLIFLWPLLLLALWGRPLSWRNRPLRPGEAEIAQESRAIVLWVAIACVLAYLLNLGIEQFVFEPRPFITHHVHLLVAHAADSSFPSDHTAWSFAVVGMLFFSLPAILLSAMRKRFASTQGRWMPLLPLFLMGLALVMACIIGIARVFVGVHYPGDIVGGAISGLFASGVVTWVRHRLQKPTQVVLQFANRLHLA